MELSSTARVAAVQLQGRPGAFDANIGAAAALAEDAFRAGARIVALPEFFASPVLYDEPFQDCVIDERDNPALRMMLDLARRHSGYIGGSVVLRRRDGVFNTYFFVQPDGRWHVHDKDLPTMWENCFYEPGRDDGRMDTALGGVGAAVCWELIRAQTIRRLQGRIRLVVTGNHWWTVPSNWPLLTPLLRGVDRINRRFAEDAPVHFARLLGVPVLHAAHCGRFRSRFLVAPGTRASVGYASEFVGATQIVDAHGRVLARRLAAEGPGLVTAELDLGTAAPSEALDPRRYWIPRLTLLHRLYWQHQNLCGRRFYRQRALARAGAATTTSGTGA